MADYTVAIAKHGSLTANTVQSVAFSTNPREVEILNRGSADIFFRLNGSNPTVSGDDCYIVQAGSSVLITDDWPNDEIRLISSGATPYSITGVGI